MALCGAHAFANVKKYWTRRLYWRRASIQVGQAFTKRLVTPLFWNCFSTISSLFFLVDWKE